MVREHYLTTLPCFLFLISFLWSPSDLQAIPILRKIKPAPLRSTLFNNGRRGAILGRKLRDTNNFNGGIEKKYKCYEPKKFRIYAIGGLLFFQSIAGGGSIWKWKVGINNFIGGKKEYNNTSLSGQKIPNSLIWGLPFYQPPW